MVEYYVYILHCADGTYYTGVTNDYLRRIQEHQSDLYPHSYTHKRRPLTLVYVSAFQDIRKAILREKQIKRWTKIKKEALIQKHFKNLHALAVCQNESHFSRLQIMTHMLSIRHTITHLSLITTKSG